MRTPRLSTAAARPPAASTAPVAAQRRWGLALAIVMPLGVGSCTPGEPPGLQLEIDTAAGGAPQWLVVFMRVGDGPDRAVGARPVDLEAAGLDPAGRAVVVALDTPDRLQGEVAIHVVGCEGPARCLSEPVRVPDCTCRPMAMGGAVVLIDGATRAPVTLRPFDAACDQDGDLFPDCAREGCCDGIPAAVVAAISDCHDAPPPGCPGCDPREAHPFRAAELPADPPPTGLAAERHARWCDDGLDNDCRAEPDVACGEGADDDGDGARAGVDCDDADPDRYPGAIEICGDGIDQDCDGADGACDRDRDGSPAGVDCDDGDPGRAPGRLEICGDGVDQDCDLLDPPCVPDDIDGDGVPCPEGMSVELGRCIGPGLDCDDLDAGVHPGARERCGDGIDQDCDGLDAPCAADDADGDGRIDGRAGGVDCDDEDPTVHPGAPERCGDGIDQDCDGSDVACADVRDGDGDGWSAPGDCDDRRADVHPYAVELCDGIDGDCDGITDEGNPLRAPGAEAAAETCGDACPGPACACRISPNACLVDTMVGAAEIRCLGIAAGEREELCNGVDDDCDGAFDEGLMRPCYGGAPVTEGVGICLGGVERCVAAEGAGAGAWGRCEGEVLPGAEQCNGADDDCDGQVDRDADGQPLQTACYPFERGQPGVGPCRAGVELCEGGGFTPCAGAVGPIDEICNNIDDDCDGTVDGMRDPCYSGPAGTRNTGRCSAGLRRCDGGRWTQCAGEVLPLDADICDGIDGDCDGRTDEDFQEMACDSGRPGRCQAGTLACNGARGITCDNVEDPQDERCDGVDDDCDGSVDEDADDACRGMEVCVDGDCERR